MYFIIIMAFAFVLSDGLPPEQCNLFRAQPAAGTIAVVVGQLAMITVAAWVGRRRTLSRLNGTHQGQESAVDRLTTTHHVLLWMIAVSLIATMVFTPWAPLVRRIPNLTKVPLAADLLILSPLFASVTLAWAILYTAEIRVRQAAFGLESAAAAEAHPTGDAEHHPPEASIGGYLLDKYRHHVFIIAAPMMLIVFAKFFTDRFKPELTRWTQLPWISDSLLGIVSVIVLLFTPVILRHVWSTEPLPPGPLRDRFIRICRRVGLKYREILLWRTHGLAVNAAVMGFIPPMRYILVSDALITTMSDEEIEAVFGHEAGHVQHWHLHFFGLFALASMYVAGGVLELLWMSQWVTDFAVLNLIALAILLLCWLFGFGWLSRRFERQADLFGVRCITPDVMTCTNWCPVHGNRADGVDTAHSDARAQAAGHGLCVSAANLFGRTLHKIADLNGIPRHAPSWRHGSIESRCRLIERFSTDPAAVKRFDRLLWRLKAGLAMFIVIGTVVAAYLYYPDIARALGWATR